MDDEYFSEEKKWAIYDVLVESELFSGQKDRLRSNFETLGNVKRSEVTLRKFKDRPGLPGMKTWALDMGSRGFGLVEGFVDVNKLKAIINV